MISAVRMMLLHPTDDPRTQGRLAEVRKVVFDGSVDQIIEENLKPECRISYYENGQVFTEIVNSKDKKIFIQNLLTENKEIISLANEKPTLEEIFYNVKGGQ